MVKYPQVKSQDIIWLDNLDLTANVEDNGGTINGTAVIANGHFTGDGATTSSINYGHLPELDVTLPELTVSIRFRTTDDTVEYLFANYSNDTDMTFYLTKVNASAMHFAVCTKTVPAKVTASYNDSTINDGEWHTLTGVYNGTDLRIYVDGVIDSGATSAQTGDVQLSTDDLFVGAQSATSGNTFTGDLKDAVILNRAWTPEEVLDWHNSTTFTEIDDINASIVLNLRSNFVTGGTTVTKNDGSTGNNFYLAANGTTTANFPVQLQPKGMYFDGTNDLLSFINTDEVINTGQAFTVVALVKLDSFVTNSYPTICELRNDGTSAWRLSASSVAGYLGFWMGSATDWSLLKNNVAVSLGKLYHVVVTYNGDGATTASNFNMYVNEETASLVASSAPGGSSQKTYIGSAGVGGQFWEGDIYSVKVFPGIEVTPTQAKELSRREFKRINK